MPDIHGFGIEATADQIGLALGAATAAGIAVHAVATNIRKKSLSTMMSRKVNLRSNKTLLSCQKELS